MIVLQTTKHSRSKMGNTQQKQKSSEGGSVIHGACTVSAQMMEAIEKVFKAQSMLEGGCGTNPDAAGAVALLEQEMSGGVVIATLLLGLCSEYGIGTAKDTQRAVQLYQEAASQGCEGAQLMLSQLWNRNGRGSKNMDLSSEHGREHSGRKQTHTAQCDTKNNEQTEASNFRGCKCWSICCRCTRLWKHSIWRVRIRTDHTSTAKQNDHSFQLRTTENELGAEGEEILFAALQANASPKALNLASEEPVKMQTSQRKTWQKPKHHRRHHREERRTEIIFRPRDKHNSHIARPHM